MRYKIAQTQKSFKLRCDSIQRYTKQKQTPLGIRMEILHMVLSLNGRKTHIPVTKVWVMCGFKCNTCVEAITKFQHCTVCKNFDMCLPCYEKNGHPHKMQYSKFDPTNLEPTDIGPFLNEKQLQNGIKLILHAAACRDSNCEAYNCKKLKAIILHTKLCKFRYINTMLCRVCKEIVALCCYHCKVCKNEKCVFPFCGSIKQKLIANYFNEE